MSALDRESAAVEDAPSDRVANRSEYWSCALLGVASAVVALTGGLGSLYLASEVLDLHPILAHIWVGAVVVSGLLLNVLPFPDTTDWVRLGTRIQLKRIYRKRDLPVNAIRHIELARPAREDYDEKQHALRFAEVTFRFRRMWPVWLLVSHSDAQRIKAWADARGVPVVYRPGWVTLTGDPPGQSRDSGRRAEVNA